MKTNRTTRILQKAGPTASLACAVHCAATPIAMVIFPAAGGVSGFSGLHEFEPFLILFGVVLGGYFLFRFGRSSVNFKSRLAGYFSALLLFGLSFFMHENSIHLVPSVIGGLLLAWSQYKIIPAGQQECASAACTH